MDFELFWHDLSLNILSKKMFRHAAVLQPLIHGLSYCLFKQTHMQKCTRTHTHAHWHSHSFRQKVALRWNVIQTDAQTSNHGHARKNINLFIHMYIDANIGACTTIYSILIMLGSDKYSLYFHQKMCIYFEKIINFRTNINETIFPLRDQ